MLIAKGKLLTSVREKQLVQWNHNKITAYFSSKTTGARVLKEKSEKDMYVLIVEMKDPPPKKTYLKMVFSGIRNSQANQGRMWKNYHSKVILRKYEGKYRSQLLNDFT